VVGQGDNKVGRWLGEEILVVGGWLGENNVGRWSEKNIGGWSGKMLVINLF